MHLSLLIVPIITIYIGSHLSLYDDEEDEYLTMKDATLFPVFASISLISLYLLITYFENFIDYFMTGYIILMGVCSLFFVISHIIHTKGRLKLKLDFDQITLLDLQFGFGEIVSLILAMAILYLYLYTKNWFLSNLIAFSFCIVAIRTIKLDNIVTGMVLLTALFFYDIFWVFKTPVMVTVAKRLDYPIKLLFPRMFVFSIDMILESQEFAMLGLGDIVIPGLFIATCLRYDLHHKGKAYFYTCLGFYTIGLGSAMFASQYYEAAQPALLYISPACILSVLGLALYRGEVPYFVQFKFEKVKESQEPATPTKKIRKMKSYDSIQTDRVLRSRTK
jgi:minor histocompatibility antigen H13